MRILVTLMCIGFRYPFLFVTFFNILYNNYNQFEEGSLHYQWNVTSHTSTTSGNTMFHFICLLYCITISH